jgi:hypothetical protein
MLNLVVHIVPLGLKKCFEGPHHKATFIITTQDAAASRYGAFILKGIS